MVAGGAVGGWYGGCFHSRCADVAKIRFSNRYEINWKAFFIRLYLVYALFTSAICWRFFKFTFSAIWRSFPLLFTFVLWFCFFSLFCVNSSMKQSKHKSTHKCDTERDKKILKKKTIKTQIHVCVTISHLRAKQVENEEKRWPYGSYKLVIL